MNLNNFIYIICLSILLGGFASCLKSDAVLPVDPVETRSGRDTLVEFEYRIDNVSASAFAFDSTDSISTYLIEVGLTSTLSTETEFYTKTIINKFTEDSTYYDYADLKMMPAREENELLDSLVYLAELYNLDSIIAADNDIPNWWFELETEVFYEIFYFGNDPIRPRGFMSQLNDNWRDQCRNFPGNGTGTSQIFTVPGIGMPWLWIIGWKDKASGFGSLFIGGSDHVFRKSFYRKRIAVFWRWGITTTDFCGPLAYYNNWSNSWLSIGI